MEDCIPAPALPQPCQDILEGRIISPLRLQQTPQMINQPLAVCYDSDSQLRRPINTHNFHARRAALHIAGIMISSLLQMSAEFVVIHQQSSSSRAV